MVAAMEGRVDRFVIPALIGFAPVVMALLTWAPNGVNGIQEVVLENAAPVFAVELVVFIIALREGLLGWLRGNLPSRPAIVAIALWLALAIGTALFAAPDVARAVRWTSHWIVHLLFGFSIAFLCCRMLRVRDLIAFYIVGFVAYSVLLLAFVWMNWGRPIDWVRALPGVLHIRHVAIYAAAITGMSIGLLASGQNRLEKTLGFVVATLGFALGWWTGSRGMVLSVVGATLVAGILHPQMRVVRVLGSAALSLMIAIAAVAWIPVPNSRMMGVARTIAATTEHEITTGRTQIWANVMHAISRQPVFGYGAGQMPIVAPYGTMGQPHDLVLQILLDWGFSGLACVLLAAFFYVRGAIRAFRAESACITAPLMAMLSLLLLSMIDAAMYHVLPVSIFVACAGMIAAQTSLDHEGQIPPKTPSDGPGREASAP